MDRRLLDYVPHIIRDVRELRAILEDAEQLEAALLWAATDTTFADQFVETATEYGVARWEAMLKIQPKAEDTLKHRRFAVLTRLIEQLPFTLTTLEQQLDQLCGEEGYSLVLHHNMYTLVVRVALNQEPMYEAVRDLLSRVVPANILVDMGLMYNEYRHLEPFTHDDLTRFTYEGLRMEVLE